MASKGLTAAVLSQKRAVLVSAADKGLRPEKWANGFAGPRNPRLRKETEAAERDAGEGPAMRAEEISAREINGTITAHFTMRIFGNYCT